MRRVETNADVLGVDLDHDDVGVGDADRLPVHANLQDVENRLRRQGQTLLVGGRNDHEVDVRAVKVRNLERGLGIDCGRRATFVDVAVAVVVDAVVAGLGGRGVDAVAVVHAVGIQIFGRVVAIAVMLRVVLEGRSVDADDGRFARQAVAVVVLVDVHLRRQTFVGLVVAVVVDAVTGLGGIGVNCRAALLGVVVAIDLRAVTVAILVQVDDGRGGRGGRGRNLGRGDRGRLIDDVVDLVGGAVVGVVEHRHVGLVPTRNEEQSGRDGQHGTQQETIELHGNFLFPFGRSISPNGTLRQA